MNNLIKRSTQLAIVIIVFAVAFTAQIKAQHTQNEAQQYKNPEYFTLKPIVEQRFGFTQAIKVGDIIKVTGVTSIDDQGNPTGIDDFEQQLKNCYVDIDIILKHYGVTYDDVIVENIYTTNMTQLQKYSSIRKEKYKTHMGNVTVKNTSMSRQVW